MTRMRSWFIVIVVLLAHAGVEARDPTAFQRGGKKGMDGPNSVLILDGTTVHTVGELQMHFINWGEWGSRPNTGQPYSLQPSAQWPAGSGRRVSLQRRRMDRRPAQRHSRRDDGGVRKRVSADARSA